MIFIFQSRMPVSQPGCLIKHRAADFSLSLSLLLCLVLELGQISSGSSGEMVNWSNQYSSSKRKMFLHSGQEVAEEGIQAGHPSNIIEFGRILVN